MDWIYQLSLTCNQPELLNAGAGFLLNPILVPGQLATHLYLLSYVMKLEVEGPVGTRLLVGGPSGLLDIVLWAV